MFLTFSTNELLFVYVKFTPPFTINFGDFCKLDAVKVDDAPHSDGNKIKFRIKIDIMLSYD